MTLLAGLIALLLAAVHVGAGRLTFLDRVPRRRWISAAGGVSVAYIFVHVLPDLGRHQARIAERIGPVFEFFEHHVYVVALLGLVAFYGLERAATSARAERRRGGGADDAGPGVFRLHVASYAAYNALIGYLLLHREEPGASGLLLFAVAMALHFVVNDVGLREHHKAAYGRVGRWVLAGAVLAGWVVGLAVEVDEAAVAVLFAFLAGGTIMNVLKEELPAERESSFGAFLAGAAGYAALLLLRP